MFKIPLTNMLGGVGMSYFSCAYSLFMPIYALTVTGLSSAVARMTAQSIALGMYRNARRVRQTALILFSAVGLAGSLLIVLLASPFSRYIADCPQSELAVLMIAPSVFFGCITAVERGYYEGMSNMYPTAFSQLVEGVIKLAAGLIMCSYVSENEEIVRRYFSGDIRIISAAAGIFGVTLSSVGAAFFMGCVRFFEKRHTGGENMVVSRRDISGQLISIALPSGISAVVTNLTALIDMWTVIGCISYFGIYNNVPDDIAESDIPHFIYGSFSGIALTVFNLVPSVTNMLGKGILPAITEAWENHNSEMLRKNTVQALLTACLISVPAAIGIGVLSEEILCFLFPLQTDEVAVCINSLRLLMLGMVCLCVSFPLFSMLQAIGKPSAPLKIMLVGAVVKFIGNILLIPVLGVDGAAVSTSLCYVIILVMALVIYMRETKMTISLKPFAEVIYSGALCGASAYLISDIMKVHGAGNTAVLMVSSFCGAVVYGVSLIVVYGLPFSIKEKRQQTGLPPLYSSKNLFS
jgi:stage V sporulation protein B